MSQADRDTMEAAIEKLLSEANIPGAKLTLRKFLLGAGVKEARRIIAEAEKGRC